MEPWDRVQVARHPQRPTTLDYIKELFEDFIQLHGDRNYGDDAAIVGGIASFEIHSSNSYWSSTWKRYKRKH